MKFLFEQSYMNDQLDNEDEDAIIEDLSSASTAKVKAEDEDTLMEDKKLLATTSQEAADANELSE